VRYWGLEESVTTENTILRICQTCGNQVESADTTCPRDGGPLINAPSDPLIGTLLLDKYQITGLLGRGGMSAVYKAKHVLMDRWVAIKFLRAELVSDPQMLKRFQQESKAVSMLKHPNVMSCHDFGLTPNGVPYLIMDFLEGKTLTEVLDQEGQLAAPRCVELFGQICDALAHAHKKGVVHRDIKPSNMIILTTDDGHESIKLVDFGIAKLLEREGVDVTKLTNAGDVLGSPAYMSPEQCCGRPCDPRSDIYALGCVIYESLTGTPALRGQSAIETMLKHVNDYPAAFNDVRPDLHLSEALQAVIFRAIAKDPDNRQQSMSELKEELQEAMGSSAGAPVAVKQRTEPSKTDHTMPAVMVPQAVAELVPLKTSASSAENFDDDLSPSVLLAPSLDLFGNQLMPAADQVGRTTGGATSSDHGDSGKLFSEPEPSAVLNLRTGIDSGDLFGNQKLLPAASDQFKSSSGTESGGSSGDHGSAFGDSGSVFGDRGSVPSDPYQYTTSNQTQSDVTSNTTSGSTLTTSTPKNTGLIVAGIAAALIGVIAIGGVGAYFLLHPATNTGGTVNPPPGPGPNPVHTGPTAAMNATEIFTTCKPSIVTLVIVNKALQVKVAGLKLTAMGADGPVVAAADNNNKISLFSQGAPAKVVAAVLSTPKGDVKVAVILVDGQPVLMPISKEGKPLMNNGKPIYMKDGVSLGSYEIEVKGTGFYVKPDIVATNCHVVSAGGVGEAGFAGGTAQVFDKQGQMAIFEKPLIYDKTNDLALLYIPGAAAKPLELRDDYSTLTIGEAVYALGSPMGMDASISPGIISADKLRKEDEDGPAVFLQHTAKIDHGNSGGPLVDSYGKVVGVNQAYKGNGSINLAVMSKCISDLLAKPSVQEKIEKFSKDGQADLRG